MASADEKKELIKLARRGKLEGDDGFRFKLAELNRLGISGPGHEYGLDFSEKPFFRSALWEATWKNHEAIVRLLVEKRATLSWADYQGRTPLHEAAYYGYQGLVEYLLEKGHPIDPSDKFGQTPLFRAVDAGRHTIVELLVSRKAELNRLDNDSTTTQHLAAFNAMPDMSDWLLYKGAWKNRFALEEKAQPPVWRASAALANEPSRTMVTEPDEEEALQPPPKPERKEGGEAGRPTVARAQYTD